MSIHQLINQIKPETQEVKDYDDILNGNESLMNLRPWKKDPKYFNKVYISSLALFKMANLAIKGGNIEVMGSLLGKVNDNCIIVTDVFAIPVEGTETRVNAQIEGYEYMVSYLQASNQINDKENIVGWYHSHPGYGCWLSGIDVSTQSLNQIQDPYLAIVVDPIKSINLGKIDIGAFRTYPEDVRVESNEARRAKFGNYSDRYYSLDIEIYTSEVDKQLINFINEETWINELLIKQEVEDSKEGELVDNIKKIIQKVTETIEEGMEVQRDMNRSRFNNSYMSRVKKEEFVKSKKFKGKGVDEELKGMIGEVSNTEVNGVFRQQVLDSIFRG